MLRLFGPHRVSFLALLVILLKLVSNFCKSVLPLAFSERKLDLTEPYVQSTNTAFLWIVVFTSAWNWLVPYPPSFYLCFFLSLCQVVVVAVLSLLPFCSTAFAEATLFGCQAFTGISLFVLSNLSTAWSLTRREPVGRVKLVGTLLAQVLQVLYLPCVTTHTRTHAHTHAKSLSLPPLSPLLSLARIVSVS